MRQWKTQESNRLPLMYQYESLFERFLIRHHEHFNQFGNLKTTKNFSQKKKDFHHL